MSDGAFQFTIGTIECVLVSDGGSAYPPEWVFRNAPEHQRIEALRARGLPSTEVPSVYNCLLVNTGRACVLIDTGMGAFAPTTGKLIESLRAAGTEPSDIDTVLFTHGHPDHIGGNVDSEGKPAFPNARYVMLEEEFNFWTSDETLSRLEAGQIHQLPDLEQGMAFYIRRNLVGIRDRFDLIQAGREIVPGIEGIPAPGHTLHHMALAITSGDERVILASDVAINPIHLEHPDWYPIFDLDPEQAVATRRRIFDQIVAEDVPIFVYHYPYPGLGRVERTDQGWHWEPDASR